MKRIMETNKLPAEVLCEACMKNNEDCYVVLPSCSECPLRAALLKYDYDLSRLNN